MRPFYTFILFILFILFSILFSSISNISMASGSERSCSRLSPSYIVQEEKPFILRYYVEFGPKVGGNTPIAPRGSFHGKDGFFYFQDNTVIDLTGSDGPSEDKRFIVRKGYEKAMFSPYEKTTYTNGDVSFSGSHIEEADGGIIYRQFWNYCRESSKYNCIVYNGGYHTPCIKEGAYVRDEYSETPPKETSPPSLRIEDVFRKPDDDFSHEDKAATTRKSTLKDIVHPSSESKSLVSIIEKTRESPLSKTDTIKKNKACSVNGEIIKNIIFPRKYKFFGNIKNIKNVNAYWYDPSLPTSPNKEDFTIDLSSLKESNMEIEAYNYTSKKMDNGEYIIPIKFHILPKITRSALPTSDYKTNTMNIVVIGDPRSISISGMEKMEKILFKKSKGMYQWKIYWYSIKNDGNLTFKKNVSSFLKLIETTKKMKSKKILLTDDENFETFINSLEHRIINHKENIDYLIWVKHGYQLPLRTPDLFSQFIKNIHDNGNISYRNNGNLYKWLYILSGNMPGGSKTLLEEPMRRAEFNPGQVDEEKEITNPRSLLKNPERLALSLDISGKRNSSVLDVASENLFVDANQVLKSTGLLIPIDHIEDSEKTQGISKSILKSIRKKDRTTSLRKECTHILFNGKDMGLDWINE